jgi:hypothetical protein
MATFNDGRTVAVGALVRLDGRTGTVTRTSEQSGNEGAVTVEVSVPARVLDPVS